MIINENWDKILNSVLNTQEFKTLLNVVKTEYENKVVYPPQEDIFKVYKLLDLEQIKVVILGQDPYHTRGMADGIAFSVSDNSLKIPPSLKNIFKELERDLGISNKNKDLTNWVKQGVFLLNTTLTVEEGKPASHSKLGWEKLTVETIKQISEKQPKVVFLLWGNFAQSFEKYIDKSKHTVLKTSHPSPLSVNKGFHGCGHFSQVQSIMNSKFDFTT